MNIPLGYPILISFGYIKWNTVLVVLYLYFNFKAPAYCFPYDCIFLMINDAEPLFIFILFQVKKTIWMSFSWKKIYVVLLPIYKLDYLFLLLLSWLNSYLFWILTSYLT